MAFIAITEVRILGDFEKDWIRKAKKLTCAIA